MLSQSLKSRLKVKCQGLRWIFMDAISVAKRIDLAREEPQMRNVRRLLRRREGLDNGAVRMEH